MLSYLDSGGFSFDMTTRGNNANGYNGNRVFLIDFCHAMVKLPKFDLVVKVSFWEDVDGFPLFEVFHSPWDNLLAVFGEGIDLFHPLEKVFGNGNGESWSNHHMNRFFHECDDKEGIGGREMVGAVDTGGCCFIEVLLSPDLKLYECTEVDSDGRTVDFIHASGKPVHSSPFLFTFSHP